MAYEQKDGQGSLFKNKRKETESHPDYNGSVTINGVEHWLSAWIKTPKSGGEKYMSLSIGKPKEQRQAAPKSEPVSQGTPFDDDIPF
jgi:uncharacterized protein (DUF736 family)